TQSALLEAMQEKQITVGRRTLRLEEPFCVMATQNPVEQEGTYPLPEAQLDRFLFKLIVDYPAEREYAEILELRKIVRSVPVPENAQAYAVRLVMATQPRSGHAPQMVDEMVALGSSPRGAQALLLGAKVKALLAGRYAVASKDVAAVAPAVLRHRVMTNFQAHSRRIGAEDVVREVLAKVAPDRV